MFIYENNDENFFPFSLIIIIYIIIYSLINPYNLNDHSHTLLNFFCPHIKFISLYCNAKKQLPYVNFL